MVLFTASSMGAESGAGVAADVLQLAIGKFSISDLVTKDVNFHPCLT